MSDVSRRKSPVDAEMSAVMSMSENTSLSRAGGGSGISYIKGCRALSVRRAFFLTKILLLKKKKKEMMKKKKKRTTKRKIKKERGKKKE